jgi:hypothetical protein
MVKLPQHSRRKSWNVAISMAKHDIQAFANIVTSMPFSFALLLVRTAPDRSQRPRKTVSPHCSNGSRPRDFARQSVLACQIMMFVCIVDRSQCRVLQGSPPCAECLRNRTASHMAEYNTYCWLMIEAKSNARHALCCCVWCCETTVTVLQLRLAVGLHVQRQSAGRLRVNMCAALRDRRWNHRHA